MESKIYQKFYTRELKKLYGNCIKNISEIQEIGEEILLLIRVKKKINSHDIRTHQVLSLFKEMLERIDGIVILMKSKSLLNAEIILRSFFEIVLDLKVILKDSSNESALNYMYFKYGDYILKLESYGGKTTEEIQQEWDELKVFASIYSFSCLEDTHKKNVIKYRSKWYEYNKNDNIEYKRKIENQYYGNLCIKTHGQNSVLDNTLSDKYIFSLKLLRSPENTGKIFFTIINLFYQIVELIFEQYIEDKKKKEEIKEKLAILNKKGKTLIRSGEEIMKKENIEKLKIIL